MPKTTQSAAFIRQDYRLQVSDAWNIKTKDARGNDWHRRQDGVIGLSRIVSVLTAGGAIIADCSRDQETDLRTRSNKGLNHWMERRTAKYFDEYGDKKTRVIGSFASRLAVEASGHRVVSSGSRPLEWLPIFDHAAQSLSSRKIGNYAIKINTDQPSNSPRDAVLFGVGEGNPEDGLWTDFYHVVGAGLDAFRADRQKGTNLRQALYVAEVAINKSVQTLQAART